MRQLLILSVLIVLSAVNALAKVSIPFMNVTVIALDSVEAAAVLGKEDNYVSGFSTFDIKSKTGDLNATAPAVYLQHAAKQARSWTSTEQEQLVKSFNEIATGLIAQGISLNLPEEVYVLKTTMEEEYGAEGYTRGNSIVLNTTGSLGISTGLVAHELFHVFSRANEKKRDELYSVFGFKKCNPINVKQALNNNSISNPDCPVIEHYITVNGEDMTLVLYSSRPYTGGDVFSEYVKVGLLILEGEGQNKKAKMDNGAAVIKEFQNVPGFFEVIGMNTPYILHAEEISAEHFSKIITKSTVQQQALLDKFKAILKS